MVTGNREEPRIVLAAYDLLLELYTAVRLFPRSQQILLGQKIQESMLALLLGLVEANRRRRKGRALESADAELEKLRFLVRLAHDLRFLGEKRYLAQSERIAELGRMLGGWRKWAADAEGGRGRLRTAPGEERQGRPAGEGTP